VILICGYELKSNPPATISWTSPSQEIVVNNDSFRMNNGTEEISLMIANVSADDNGTWTCTVEVPRNQPSNCSFERAIVKRHMNLTVVSKYGRLKSCVNC
jgi:hypothetical protein